MKIGMFTLVLLTLLFSACKKDEKEPVVIGTTGHCSLKLYHVWQEPAYPVYMDTLYVNAVTNDSLSFTTFKYYVSNIRLKKSDGSWYVQPNSYYLVDLSTGPEFQIGLDDVPVGDYTDIQYTFGVDSTRNVSGVQSGALSPSNGMFWSWNTGYIMSKAEGISPNSSSGAFAFHLGGFHGANSVVTEKTINLSGLNTLNISPGATGIIGVSVDIAKMWQGSPGLSVTSDLQAPGAAAKTMAVSFVSGMTLDYVTD